MNKTKTFKSRLLVLTVISVLLLISATIGLIGCGKTPVPTEKDDPPPVAITVTLGEVTNGSLTKDKSEYFVGDDVIITVSPNEGYALVELTVNGANKTADVVNGRLTLSAVETDITVNAQFAQRTAASVELKPIASGGTATLDKTSGLYVGDRVILTVAPERTHKTASILVNGTEKAAWLDENNRLTLVLASEVNDIEVVFAEIRVKVNVVSNNTAYGTVTVENAKDTYGIGDKVTVAAAVVSVEDHEFKNLLVNGVDMLDAMENGKLVLDVEQEGVINITAVFSHKPIAIDIPVDAKKWHETRDVDGEELVLENDDNNYAFEVENGKITGEVVPGTYSVSLDGYAVTSVKIEKGDVPEKISLKYQLMDANSADVAADRWDINTFDKGYIENKNGWGADFADTYGDFVLRTNFYEKLDTDNYTYNGGDGSGKPEKQNRTVVCITPVGSEKYFLPIQVIKGYWAGSYYYTINLEGYDGNTHPQVPPTSPSEKYNFSTDEWRKAQYDRQNGAEGLFGVVARKGNRMAVFLETEKDGTPTLEYCWGCELMTDGSTPKVNIQIQQQWASSDVTRNYIDMRVDEAEVNKFMNVEINTSLVKCTVTPETPTIIGGQITLALAPTGTTDANHKSVLKSFKIDGVDKTSEVQHGKYTFTATKNSYDVVAEYEEVELRDLTVNISGEKPSGACDISSVRLYNADFDQTLAVTAGSITVNSLPLGAYTIEADGYIAQTVNHTDTTAKTVKLVYQLFDNTEGDSRWNVNTLGDGYIENMNGWDLPFKDAYGDFVFETSFYKGKSGQDSKMGFYMSLGDVNLTIEVDQWDTGVYVKAYTGEKEGSPDIWNDIYLNSKYPDDSAWQYGKYINAYNTTSITDGLDGAIVRKGDKVYLFFGTESGGMKFFDSFTLPAGMTSESKVGLKLIHKNFETTVSRTKAAMSTKEVDVNKYVAPVELKQSTVTGGTASLKGSYRLGDDVTIVISSTTEASSDKRVTLTAFTVDGVDHVSDVQKSGNNYEYTFKAYKAEYTVGATFTVVDIATLNLAITDDRPDGIGSALTAITVKGTGFEQTVNLDNGAISIADLPLGEYTISADGYISETVTLANSTQQAVKMTYQLFNNTEGDDRWNVNTLGDGYIENISGWDLHFKDSYGDFALEMKFHAKADVNDSKMGFWLAVGTNTVAIEVNEYNKGVYIKAYSGIADSESGWDYASGSAQTTIWSDVYLHDKWSGGVGTWQDSQYMGDGLDGVIVRKGNKLYLFLKESQDGGMILFNVIDLPNEIGASQARMKLFCPDWVANTKHRIALSMSTKEADVNKYVAPVELKQSTVTGGTASLKGSYRLGDDVTIVISPTTEASSDKRVTLTAFTVDGVDHVSDVQKSGNNYEYTFKAYKAEYTVGATFTVVDIATLNLAITDDRPEGIGGELTAVTVKGTGFEQTVNLDNGAISVADLPLGEYTISADGYISKTVTLANSTQQAVKMTYQLFNNTEGDSRWNVNTLGDGYIENMNGWDLPFKDAYGDFVFETSFYKGKSGQDSKMGFYMSFGDVNLTIEVDQWDTGVYVKAYTGEKEGSPDIWTDKYLVDKYPADSAWQYGKYINAYNTTSITDGLDATIVRKGDKVYLFFATENGGMKFFDSFTLPAGMTAESKVGLKLIHKNFEATVSRTKAVMSTSSDKINEYLDLVPTE